jgi:hypothetical protein
MLKDNFSDFEGIKVIACAREEALKLLAQIQSDAETRPNFLAGARNHLKTLMKFMPVVLHSVYQDSEHSRLNFFMIVKALVHYASDQARSDMLKLFGKFLIECLPLIEDEPKVAVTEILNILLPVFLTEQLAVTPYSNKSVVVQTFKLLLNNLSENL